MSYISLKEDISLALRSGDYISLFRIMTANDLVFFQSASDFGICRRCFIDNDYNVLDWNYTGTETNIDRDISRDKLVTYSLNHLDTDSRSLLVKFYKYFIRGVNCFGIPTYDLENNSEELKKSYSKLIESVKSDLNKLVIYFDKLDKSELDSKEELNANSIEELKKCINSLSSMMANNKVASEIKHLGSIIEGC